MNVQTRTLAWIDAFIIGQGICPFARKERLAEAIQLVTITYQNTELLCKIMRDHYASLQASSSITTSIVVIEKGLEDFWDYLNVLESLNIDLRKSGFEGIFQLASFHPNYLFAGVPDNDLSHFSNRSPYPMFHIIDEVLLEHTLQNFAHPERIPERNIEHCRALGAAYFANLLKV